MNDDEILYYLRDVNAEVRLSMEDWRSRVDFQNFACIPMTDAVFEKTWNNVGLHVFHNFPLNSF